MDNILFNQGYEAAVQIDGKVYDLQTLTNTFVASPILFYTRVKSTNAPILIEATVQDSVRFLLKFNFILSSICFTLFFDF